MNLTDFIIIYLTGGAPFAVHFFLRRRAANDRKKLWLKTALAFVFWLPLAFLTFRQFKKSKWRAVSNLNNNFPDEITLSATQKNLEAFLRATDSPISLFEFRQTIERYADLTILSNDATEKPTTRETEVFRRANRKDVEIAAVCLHRRNRKRLAFHQTEARKDFLRTIEILHGSLQNADRFGNAVNEFVQILKDSTAQENVEKIFAANLQTGKPPRLNYLETEVLWKPEMPEPLHTPTARSRQTILAAMTNLRGRD